MRACVRNVSGETDSGFVPQCTLAMHANIIMPSADAGPRLVPGLRLVR
jgi:hypothetical protein